MIAAVMDRLPPSSPPSSRSARPTRAGVLIGAGGLAVAVIVVAVVTLGREDGGGEMSGCLSGLAGQAPADGAVVQGADLERARAAGLDDTGGFDGATEWLIDTGVPLDPLASQARATRPGEDPSSVIGYDPSDVRCWVGGMGSYAARGSFAREGVAASEIGETGEIDVDDDLLIRRDGDGTTGARPGLAPVVVDLVTALDELGTVGFSGISTDDEDERWTAVGLAHGDGWDLVIVWAFADGTTAGDGEERIREVLAGGESAVGDMVRGDPAERLDRAGATVRLRAPLATEATSDWYRLQTVLDPIVLLRDR